MLSQFGRRINQRIEKLLGESNQQLTVNKSHRKWHTSSASGSTRSPASICCNSSWILPLYVRTWYIEEEYGKDKKWPKITHPVITVSTFGGSTSIEVVNRLRWSAPTRNRAEASSGTFLSNSQFTLFGTHLTEWPDDCKKNTSLFRKRKNWIGQKYVEIPPIACINISDRTDEGRFI
jgi:hypothetical protein